MATTLHEAPTTRLQWFQMRELWTSLAITVMWVAVLFTAIFGGDMHFESSPTNTSTIPSGAAVALFAAFASWGVARYGYRRKD